MPLLLAQLGSTPALSLAELHHTVPDFVPRAFGPGWVTAELATIPRIDRLGGTVRFVRLRGEDPVPEAALHDALLALLLAEDGPGRLEFGLTLLDGTLPLQQIGLTLKAALKQRGISARFASSGGRQLASVLVRKKGVVELALAKVAGGWLVGRTAAVQDVDAYVFRDTHKPARNLERGMLPPKLAQILLNLAAAPPGTVTLDPFCGTGTVLLEALVQGREVRGFDNDPTAVEEARRNLRWFGIISREDFPEDWVLLADATAMPEVPRLGAIATEGTLGTLLHKEPTPQQAERTFSEIAKVYAQLFRSAAAQLPPGGCIALTVPAFRTAAGTQTFQAHGFRQLLPAGLELIPLLPDALAARVLPRLTDKGGIVVERPDQFVGREVVLLRRG